MISWWETPFSRSVHCRPFMQTLEQLVSNSCSQVTACDASTCHIEMRVLDAAEASPWQRLLCCTLACAKEPPGSTCSPVLLLSAVAAPVFQAATLFQQWLITILMKCEGSGNVTGMTWACQCGPAGRSVSHTDIWTDMELAAFSKKELLITWAAFCWIYVTQFLNLFYYICTLASAPHVWISSWCLLLSLHWLNEM